MGMCSFIGGYKIFIDSLPLYRMVHIVLYLFRSIGAYVLFIFSILLLYFLIKYYGEKIKIKDTLNIEDFINYPFNKKILLRIIILSLLLGSIIGSFVEINRDNSVDYYDVYLYYSIFPNSRDTYSLTSDCATLDFKETGTNITIQQLLNTNESLYNEHLSFAVSVNKINDIYNFNSKSINLVNSSKIKRIDVERISLEKEDYRKSYSETIYEIDKNNNIIKNVNGSVSTINDIIEIELNPNIFNSTDRSYYLIKFIPRDNFSFDKINDVLLHILTLENGIIRWSSNFENKYSKMSDSNNSKVEVYEPYYPGIQMSKDYDFPVYDVELYNRNKERLLIILNITSSVLLGSLLSLYLKPLFGKDKPKPTKPKATPKPVKSIK